MGWQQNVVPLLIVDATGGYTGIFIYSPQPGPGNLIGSWAAQAGTDPFGNSYPAGLTSQQGNISGSTITGSTFQGFNFVIDNNGIRLYEAPAPPPPPPPPPPTITIFKVAGSTSAGTSFNQTIAVTAATAANDLIHVAACAASGGPAVTSVADSKSNSYVQQSSDATQIPTSVWMAAGATVALTTADTITVNYASSLTQKLVSVCAVRGLISAPVDSHVSAAGSSNNPMVTSGALVESTELALAVFGTANGGGNPSLAPGLSIVDQRQFGGSQYLTVASQFLASTSAFTAGATITSAKWAALLTTLKEV